MSKREWIYSDEAIELLGLSQPQLSRLSHPSRVRRKWAPKSRDGKIFHWLYSRSDIEEYLGGECDEKFVDSEYDE